MVVYPLGLVLRQLCRMAVKGPVFLVLGLGGAKLLGGLMEGALYVYRFVPFKVPVCWLVLVRLLWSEVAVANVFRMPLYSNRGSPEVPRTLVRQSYNFDSAFLRTFVCRFVKDTDR